MKIKNLVGEELCNSINEVRLSTDEYEEMVILSKDMLDWGTMLTEKLGPPLVSAEKIVIEGSAKKEYLAKRDVALKHANSFGGISKGQTLYHGTFDLTEILILLWPWQDNAHVTLKKAIM